jgi:DNA repair protein RadC
MPITDWPLAERPREKLLAQGAGALSDAELLAIFLRTGIRGRSAVDLARDLLTRFDGLRGMLRASKPDFCAVKGLGVAKFVQMQACLEMSRRFLFAELKAGRALSSPGGARDYLVALLRDIDHEVFGALFLDSQHQVLGFEALARGTLDAAAVYPREVVKAALRHNAAAVIFAHNHPSGVAEPSAADRVLTDRLKSALQQVDIRVLDHFVIGEGRPASFAERGLL